MENENIFCSACGTVLPADARFCHCCGKPTVQEPQAVFCKSCGKKLLPDAVFCSDCGTKANASFAQAPAARAKRPKHELFRFIRKTILKSSILLVSLLALIFAFLPFHGFAFKAEDEKVHAGITPLDSIVFVTDMLHFQTEEELRDSSLYEDYRDALSDADDEEEMAESSVYYGMRLGLRSEDTPFLLTVLLTALLSVLYFATVITLFVYALLDLLYFLLGKETPKYSTLALKMLAALPVFAVVLTIAFGFAYGNGDALSSIGADVYTPTGVVLTVVLSLLALSGVAVCRFFFSGARCKVYPKEIVKRSLSCLGATVLLFSVCIPVMSLNVKTVFSGDSAPKEASASFDASYFDNLMPTDTFFEEYDIANENENTLTLKNTFKSFSYYSASNFRSGKATMTLGHTFVLTAFASFGAASFSIAFAQIAPLMLVIAILAGVLLWKNFLAIVMIDAKQSTGLINCAKVLALVLSVIVLALLITFILITNANLDTVNFGENAYASLSLGAGVIVTLIFSIFTLSVPMIKKKS